MDSPFCFNENNTWISIDFLHSYFDSKEDFEAFTEEEGTDDCMDIDPEERLTDLEVLRLLQEITGLICNTTKTTLERNKTYLWCPE